MSLWLKILLILLLAFEWWILINANESNDDFSYGLRVSLNDNFTVATFNKFHTYAIRFLSKMINIECEIRYRYPELNVYSLSALMMKPESDTFSFVQISENTSSHHVILSVVTSNITNCKRKNEPTMLNQIVWTHGHQESILLKADPQEEYAYVFADSFVLSYNLFTKKVIQSFNNTFFDENVETFIPKAVDLTNELAIVTGYSPYQRFDLHLWKIYPIQLRPKMASLCPVSNASSIIDNIIRMGKSDQTPKNRNYGMSVSIDPSGRFTAFGSTLLNIVRIYKISDNKNCARGNVTFGTIRPNIGSNMQDIGFGRSIAWLDDKGTLAVLVYKSTNQTWSESEIYVFKNISTNSNIVDAQPDFILPNNQQTLAPLPKASFLFILAHANNLLILRNDHKYLYVPATEAGNLPTLIDSWKCHACIMRLKPCVSGSYKDAPGVGPCTVCPPGLRNPGYRPSVHCQACNLTTFCPRGASNEVNLNDFLSYNQTFSYPNSPIIDNYDDLLILNFLNIDHTIHCIVASPLFWAALAIVCCFIIWLIMCLVKMRRINVMDTHRKRIKYVLKKFDLFGEGKHWIGGLISFVILFLIMFSCWFAYDYFHSYPIETAKTYRALCKNNQMNTKFSNGLQVPLPAADGTLWKIFEMLNHQNLTMTVYLINTRTLCDNIIVERLRYRGTPQLLKIKGCNLSNIYPVVSFSVDLYTHTENIQVTINGPHFIGAVRLCLYGPQLIEDTLSGIHRLRELDVCNLFYTENQTIGLTTNFNVRLIKVINITEPLKGNDRIIFDGRWAPTTKYVDDLSDELYFEKDGQYLRYASHTTKFILRFKEETYFLENIQSPIIRLQALVFHTLLFFSLLIEIVGILFLMFKLCCSPLLRLFLPSFHDNSFKYDLRMNKIQSNINSENPQFNDNLGSTIMNTSDEKLHCCCCTKNDRKILTRPAGTEQSRSSFTEMMIKNSLPPTTISTTEVVTSPEHANFQRSFEYFDKRLDALQTQIDELNRQISHLRQRPT
ncbi:unnamed protein product [Rotaria sp. Silwood2]|nr:unnamed protein product [Rotaria sp. Silwood2]